MASYLLLFLKLMLFIALSYFSGSWILQKFSIKNKTSFHHLFFSCLLAAFIFTSMSALLFCQFRTIFSVLLILLLPALFHYTQSHKFHFSLSEKAVFKIPASYSIISLLIVLLFLFCWFGSLLVSGNFELGLPANPENILYSQFAKNIASSGIESTFRIGLLAQNSSNYLSPYHYFDLWFTAGVSHLFSISDLLAIHFFTLPFFAFLNVLGLCALFESVTKHRFYFPLVAVLLLFISGCYYFPGGLEFSKYHFDYLEPLLGLYGEKLSFAFTCFTAVLLLYLNHQKIISFHLLLLIPFLFPSFLFSIYLGFPLFLFLTYRQAHINLKEIKALLLFQFIAMLSYILFYSAFGNSVFNLSEISDYKGVNLSSFKMVVAEIIYRAWDKPLRSMFIYAPFVLIALLVIRKHPLEPMLKQLGQLGLCLYFAALISWAFVYKMPEAWQLYTNVFVFLHLLLISFIVIPLIKFTNGIKSPLPKIVLLVLLLTAAFNAKQSYLTAKENYSYSASFLQKINALLAAEKNSFVVAYCKNPGEYISTSEYTTGGLTGAYLQLQPHFYGLVNIGFYSLLNESLIAGPLKNKFQNQDFYQFVEKEKEENKFVSTEQSQVNFLVQEHIQYLALSPKAIVPDLIQKRIVSSLDDKKTGEKFLILDISATFK